MIYLLEEKIGDSNWKVLGYCDTVVDKAAALSWSKVSPRNIAIDGFPVYRRLTLVRPKEWTT